MGWGLEGLKTKKTLEQLRPKITWYLELFPTLRVDLIFKNLVSLYSVAN